MSIGEIMIMMMKMIMIGEQDDNDNDYHLGSHLPRLDHVHW